MYVRRTDISLPVPLAYRRRYACREQSRCKVVNSKVILSPLYTYQLLVANSLFAENYPSVDRFFRCQMCTKSVAANCWRRTYTHIIQWLHLSCQLRKESCWQLKNRYVYGGLYSVYLVHVLLIDSPYAWPYNVDVDPSRPSCYLVAAEASCCHGCCMFTAEEWLYSTDSGSTFKGAERCPLLYGVWHWDRWMHCLLLARFSLAC